MNGMSTSTLWLILHYPSCKEPNTAIHDQAVDETQATEDTQQDAIDLCNHKRWSCICNQETKIKKGSWPMWNNTASHIYKLYSIVLMTRIERWAIHNNLIPDAQFGFCKYRSQYTWLYLYSENMHRSLLVSMVRGLWISFLSVYVCHCDIHIPHTCAMEFKHEHTFTHVQHTPYTHISAHSHTHTHTFHALKHTYSLREGVLARPPGVVERAQRAFWRTCQSCGMRSCTRVNMTSPTSCSHWPPLIRTESLNCDGLMHCYMLVWSVYDHTAMTII